MNEPSTTADMVPQRRSWLMALPLIAFAALAAIFWFRLGDGDPSRIPSALIGHPAPQTTLPPLVDLAIRRCLGLETVLDLLHRAPEILCRARPARGIDARGA